MYVLLSAVEFATEMATERDKEQEHIIFNLIVRT